MAIYLLGLLALHMALGTTLPAGPGLTPLVAPPRRLAAWTPSPVLLTGLLVAGLVASKLVRGPQAP